ncbi:restriction endonuclease [Streptomyces sp. NPDC005271]|uniref:restriction endonuclease n=1 Tax=unclassified Streptomyces TaxID=2593676 RepID=UPI0033A7DAEB
MAEGEAVHGGLPVHRMEVDHTLLAAPSATTRPLTVSAPHLLNTADLEWESVAHLVAWLARRVEGWEETWLYGERGQNQHGIDVVGVTGRDAAVFQAKRLKEFTRRDLEQAVDRYARGKRPFGARRLVVVTTHDANRTEISERLFELQGAYPDLQIELWNRKRLSDLLQPHPDIVTAFFGAATTQLFCPAPAAPVLSPADANEGPNAQALLRGPVAHLGLHQDVGRR